MRCRAIAVVPAAALLALAPHAMAAPTSDAQGYVDSTARCAAPDEPVLFGSTATSRVAICQTPDGDYEYRGVRLRDGAKLIAPATDSGNGFSAENDGITYLVSADSLVISAGTEVIREEDMTDVHQPQAPAETPTPTTPLPPPLPAEVGGS